MLPGTALLAGWLGRTILTLVTTYTRPGDRVLLLAPPAPSRAPGRMRDSDPYAGLAEAVWTVARLGRSADIATAAPAPDYVYDQTDSSRHSGAESETRLRPSRLGLHPVPEPNTDSVHLRRRAGDQPHGGFDLIITALDPHAMNWLRHVAWGGLLTPRGLIAVITHSDSRGGRLFDPHPVLVDTLGKRGLRCLDHIAVLTAPTSGPVVSFAGITAPHGRSPRAEGSWALPMRRVHHDLVLFRQLSLAAAETDPREGLDV